MATLLCTVRSCARPLRRLDGRLTCARGHSFDVAASGYVNLLQPQDRRSRHPGDSREVALARRRFAEAGHDRPLIEALLAEIKRVALERTPSLLDIGCGEGFLLRSLNAARNLEAYGLDISVPAIELAAKASSDATWIVA